MKNALQQTLRNKRRQVLLGFCVFFVFVLLGVWQLGISNGYSTPIDSTLPAECVSSNARRSPFAEGTDQALRAWELSQSARNPEDWHRVAQHWTQAVSAMQSVPLDDPQRALAQKKVSEYLVSANYALVQATQSGNRLPYATFNSTVLDEQFALYRSYVATFGIPDVSIVGSSRALQGIDPKMLEYEFARRGRPNVKVFNFGVNGATARVVNVILQAFLTRVETDRGRSLPKLIIWADGSRAFNSGRGDRTFDRLLASPGYRQLQNPNFAPPLTPVSLSIDAIDANGFRVVRERFDPNTYYQQYAYVPGDYDLDYANFDLGGAQSTALEAVVQFARTRNVPLITVNLPLTRSYLDPTRDRYERAFSQFLQQRLAPQEGVWVRDLSRQWLDRNDYFADPSHLNRHGAAAIARQLIQDPQLPWDTLLQ
ncbi:MAG: hypothetical protein J7641_15305 [Cyanobacteria bacterium SID2]|nr:hypothetical protein [Cyanobacteria bacterium SID2]